MIKVLFLGTPDFAVNPLKALLSNPSVKVVGVVCNNDKPLGRKRVLTPPPTKVLAEECGIPVYQYDKIRVEGVEDLRCIEADLFVTCAFGQILSKEIIDMPRYGVFNVHGSLLPKYRGASPIQASIIAGETKTGVTIMKTAEGIDTGDIIYQKEIEILPAETAGQLFDRLSVLGAECINAVISQLIDGSITYTPQNQAEASLTKMIKKEDCLLSFSQPASVLVNKIRGLNPAPVAYFNLGADTVKVFTAEAIEDGGAYKPGEIVRADKQLVIACGVGQLNVLELQKSGGKRLSAKDFLLGNKLEIGSVVE